MQYIGRKDKNGTELFKDDIVRKVDYIPGDGGDVEIISIGVVYWLETWPIQLN
jgi:uncharacterized phage protein (TIGR01671 family)